MKALCTTVLLITSLLAGMQATASPSKAISAMMDTPASVFDVFIFQLFEQSKCYQGWFGNEGSEKHVAPCMATIDYKFDDDLVEMNFFVKPEYKEMVGFASGNDSQKAKILEGLLSKVAQSVGAEPQDKLNVRLGMIQITPIRHGWSTKSLDEDAAREEIADRTVIHLRTNVGGFVYCATRNQHGKVTFEKKEVSGYLGHS